MQSRRTVLLSAAAGLAASAQAQIPVFAAASAAPTPANQGLPNIPKPELPYGLGALSPLLSEETLRLHHGAHHVGYYNRMETLAIKRGLQGLPLIELVRESHALDPDLFNAAAQVYNHNLYWQSLRLNGQSGAAIPEDLAKRLRTDFGSIEAFKQALTDTAMNTFGSGWAWLVADKRGVLSLRSTTGAGTPLTEAGIRPIITIDVWEHAYYVDYRNRRGAYLKALIDGGMNWDFAAAQYRNA